jgi:hypothetical protein
LARSGETSAGLAIRHGTIGKNKGPFSSGESLDDSLLVLLCGGARENEGRDKILGGNQHSLEYRRGATGDLQSLLIGKAGLREIRLSLLSVIKERSRPLSESSHKQRDTKE